MPYSKGFDFLFFFFFQWCCLFEQLQFNTNVQLGFLQTVQRTSTVNALKAGQTIDGPPHFYTPWSTCVQKIPFVCTSKMSNLSRPSVQAIWRIQSVQDVSIKQVLHNILTILNLVQNKQHRGKRRKGKGEV